MKTKNTKLKYLLIPIYISAILIFSCKTDENKSLLERLIEVEDFSVTKISNLVGFSECYQIDITQPIDHNNPSGETFKQRFFLSHRGTNLPMVFYTTGYGLSRNSEKELTSLIQGNQILLVHRYFPNAIPQASWEYLTIFQAASDQHRIKEILKKIYTGKWVSSGGSKGGMASLFYRYYFPDDMSATVAYVTPIMNSQYDIRFIDFLNKIGTVECREKIKRFQRMVLQKRDELMPLFETYIQEKGYSFTTIPKVAAFEYSVLEFMFAFWQYGSENGCNSIPSEQNGDNNESILNYLMQISPISYYNDTGFHYFEPLFYQAYTELGYCTFNYSHLNDLLIYVKNPSYKSFAPKGVKMDFNPNIMANVISWLQHQGEKILYLYGGIDPWTAGAIYPNLNLDSLTIIQPDANHMVRILEMDEKDLIIQTLERWLEITINGSQIKKNRYKDIRDRF